MRPHDMGTLFDDLAAAGSPTVVTLDRPFDIAPDRGLTHRMGDLAGLVADAAGWLAAAGAGPGRRVAILKPNHWDSDLLACAAIRVGALPALISDRAGAGALHVMLARLAPAVLVTTAGTVRAARQAGVDLPALAGRTLCLDGTVTGALSLADVRGSDPPAPHRRHPDDPLVVNQTSGTTGVPKLVVHSTRTIIDRLARFESVRWPVLGYRPDDTVCHAGAYVHGRTFCWTASVCSMRPRRILIITGDDPGRAGALLRAQPPSIVEALPATYVRWRGLTEAADGPFHAVRLYLSTYDAVHPPTVRAFLAASRHRRPRWLQGWGQTETGPLTFRLLTRGALATPRRHPTTRDLGHPVPVRTALRVVHPHTFRPVPTGHPGLVLARTKARALGYLGEPDRWAAKAHGAWWNTGDIGVRTRSGSLLLLDREVDTIPTGSCLELEDLIEDRLPEVIECVVLGMTDRHPVPVLLTTTGTPEPAAWHRAVADLPPLAEPLVMDATAMPRSPTGKVRRGVLRELLFADIQALGTGRWT
jgi:acyl-coenzyme A synthetase/AMP-(fatty) acid ligase